MQYRVPQILKVSVFALLLGVLFVPQANATNHEAKPAQKEIADSYLADSKGMTLYYFTKDTPGKSACLAECLAKWPVVAPAAVMAGSSGGSDFGSMTREDGTVQATFRGYPLYYFFKDAAAGETNGQGVNNVWYVVDPMNFPPKAK